MSSRRPPDVTVTSDVVTRLVELDLGATYRRHDVDVLPGTSYDVRTLIAPHRVRVLLRRDGPGWVATQVIVIGRSTLELARYDAHARSCRFDAHAACGHPRPVERQRTFTDLVTAPAWLGDVVRALLDACDEEGP